MLVASESSVVTWNLQRSWPEMCHAHTEPQMILGGSQKWNLWTVLQNMNSTFSETGEI